jgi:hypothetical protein
VHDTAGIAGLARCFLPEIRPAHRLVCLLLLASGAVGRSSELQLSTAKPLADQEPITPIPQPPTVDPRKFALGERLFGDPRLSGDGKLACSSCHDLATNGAGRSTVAHDGSKAPFDTLTVFNAPLSFRLNWQGNYRSLGEQAESSLENQTNMRTNVDEVLGKLNADAQMVQQFRAAYGRAPDRTNFLDALVTFESSGRRYRAPPRSPAHPAVAARDQSGFRNVRSGHRRARSLRRDGKRAVPRCLQRAHRHVAQLRSVGPGNRRLARFARSTA